MGVVILGRLSRMPVVEKRKSICGDLLSRAGDENDGVELDDDPGDEGPADVCGLVDVPAPAHC